MRSFQLDMEDPTTIANGTASIVSTADHKLISFLSTWVLIPQILFGSGGNILNLIVLLNKAMRSKTNIIFAAMALSDLTFLLLQSSGVLFFTGILMNNQWFRQHKLYFNFLLNWFSTTSIWLMTYATLERVQVIRSPFRSSNRHVSVRFLLSLAVIWILALVISFYHLIPRTHIRLIQSLTYINTVLVVYGPLVICTCSNWHLVQALRTNNKNWNELDDTQTHQQALFRSRAQVERKVTIVVSAIITCFVVFNVPSAVLYIVQNFVSDPHNLRFASAKAISNTLAIMGKVLNFVLFFLTSEHFRNLIRTRWLACHNKKRRSSWKSQKTASLPLDLM
ncbi:unnamed protein product [Auanema sp. JU1783]|nr:unnamed protein product [Auanema sp. JU1783]